MADDVICSSNPRRHIWYRYCSRGDTSILEIQSSQTKIDKQPEKNLVSWPQLFCWDHRRDESDGRGEKPFDSLHRHCIFFLYDHRSTRTPCYPHARGKPLVQTKYWSQLAKKQASKIALSWLTLIQVILCIRAVSSVRGTVAWEVRAGIARLTEGCKAEDDYCG